jgi:hypothetical protein
MPIYSTVIMAWRLTKSLQNLRGYNNHVGYDFSMSGGTVFTVSQWAKPLCGEKQCLTWCIRARRLRTRTFGFSVEKTDVRGFEPLKIPGFDIRQR